MFNYQLSIYLLINQTKKCTRTKSRSFKNIFNFKVDGVNKNSSVIFRSQNDYRICNLLFFKDH